MGGLAGLLEFREGPPDQAVVARMSAALAHRGPDSSGHWAEGPAAFAHRLKRFKPTRAPQPVQRDHLVVMLDGWIYDHHEVARRAGHADEGQTDTETLALAWQRWGLRLTEHLDGDFAAAIWDRHKHTLVLLRDRMGVRPLYWARSDHRFAFASELPALLCVPWVDREVVREHLAEFLSFRVVHAPRTLLRGAYQLPAAHWLRVDAQDVETRRYWALRYAPPGTRRPPDGEVLDALEEAVQRAVRRRVPPGVETGLYLSGGLGSTAIAAAAQERFLQLPSYTVSFADDPHPESPFAGRVANLLGLEHTELVVGTPELARGFADTVRALGHPVGNPAAILQMALARAARTRVRVALSGDGGEELFGGRMLDRVARSLQQAGPLARLRGATRRLLGRAQPPSVLDLGIGGTDLFSTVERQTLLRDPRLVRPGIRQEVLSVFYNGLNTDPVNTALHGYLRSWLGEGSLVRADRTAAAAGLDLRFPLLDREVMERAASLPGSFKLRRTGGSVHTRWPLRAMLSGILPPPLVNRPKRGMPTPLEGWLTGPGRLFFEDRFEALRSDRLDLWQPGALEQLRRDAWKQNGAGIRLWTLFILDAWLEQLPELAAT